MTLVFLLPFGQLNLAFLTLEKRDKVIKKYKLVSIKAMKIFKYKKNYYKYWDRAKLYYQV